MQGVFIGLNVPFQRKDSINKDNKTNEYLGNHVVFNSLNLLKITTVLLPEETKWASQRASCIKRNFQLIWNFREATEEGWHGGASTLPKPPPPPPPPPPSTPGSHYGVDNICGLNLWLVLSLIVPRGLSSGLTSGFPLSSKINTSFRGAGEEEQGQKLSLVRSSETSRFWPWTTKTHKALVQPDE